jgi:predicted NAD-dependent protein-ADP-ribosyltransferase YbiA (DUF1768 family)
MEKISVFREEYEFLSNFYRCKVEYAGNTYASSEHAYQAAKFTDPFIREKFLDPNMTAGKSKRKARELAKYIREDWEDIKLPVMKEILLSKFSSPVLAEKLLATYPAELEEGNWWGRYILGKRYTQESSRR